MCYNGLMVNKLSRGLKRGDTLIEVTIAIGIFSLIAIMAVLVVNTSISGAQSTLENTVTREEINAQAEALRFIQAAYAADKDADPEEPSKYGVLWERITNSARVLGSDDEDDMAFLSYRPSTCDELYNENAVGHQNAFVINVRALDSSDVNNILISAADYPDIFRQTTTYPRLMYGYDDSEDEVPDDVLYSLNETWAIMGGREVEVRRAEGIYVVAVQDSDGTNIVSGDTGEVSKKPAFIDFYIRTCWYALNANKPSTISTVVRLYNPDYIAN